jgi:hypothetical protein
MKQNLTPGGGDIFAKINPYRNHLYVKLYEKIGGFPRDPKKDKGMPGNT